MKVDCKEIETRQGDKASDQEDTGRDSLETGMETRTQLVRKKGHETNRHGLDQEHGRDYEKR